MAKTLSMLMTLLLLTGVYAGVSAQDDDAAKPAGDGLDLSIRFVKDHKTSARTSTITDIKMDIMGMKQHNISTNIYDTTSTCTAVNEQGGGSVKVRYDRIAIKNVENDEASTNYDSAKDKMDGLDESSMISALLVGREFSMDVDAKGKVANVKGLEEYRKAVAEKLGQEYADNVGQSQVTAVQAVEQEYQMRPRNKVAVGDSWNYDWDMDLEGMGKMKFTGKYTLEGREKKMDRDCARVSITGGMSIEVGEGVEMAMSIKDVDWKGMWWIDINTGETVLSESTMKYNLVMEIMGTEIVAPSKVDSRVELLTGQPEKKPADGAADDAADDAADEKPEEK